MSASVEGVNSAINTTAAGISATKEVVADITEEITLENAKDAIVSAFNQATITIQQTVEGLLNAIVETKQMMHEGAVNFDSRVTLRGTKNSIGTALNATTINAEALADKIGLFAAIDGMVQGIAQLPFKVRDAFGKVKIVMTEDEDAAPIDTPMEREGEVKEPKVDVKVTVNSEDVDLDNLELESVIKEEVETRLAEARSNTPVDTPTNDEELKVIEVEDFGNEGVDDGIQVEKVVIV